MFGENSINLRNKNTDLEDSDPCLSGQKPHTELKVKWDPSKLFGFGGKVNCHRQFFFLIFIVYFYFLF